MNFSPFRTWLQRQSQVSKTRYARVARDSRQRRLYLEVLEDRTVLSPVVTGIAPTFGPTAGGTSVTITGTGLGTATDVKFGGTSGVITADTATSITVLDPAHSAGTVDVTVIAPSGTSPTNPVDQFTYVAGAPTVSNVSPSSGPTSGGTTVTITGTNFQGNQTTVKFGGTLGTILSIASDGTSMTVTDPGHAAGTVDVKVTNPDGTSPTSTFDKFTYLTTPAPTVGSVTPNSGPTAGGTTVTITGTNLANATEVDFGTGNPGTIVGTPTATSITVTDPTHAAGTVNVRVTTAGGTSAINSADKFTYEAVPTVTSIAPPSGPTSGNNTVTINGSNFAGATAVTFGGTGATIVSNNGTQIVVTAPAHAVGTVDVKVTTAGGTSAIVAGDQYTYVAAPTVSAITPTTGPTAGGTSVTITGTGFTNATAVNFGGVAIPFPSFSIVDDNHITVASPPESAGTVHVTVTTASGTSSTSAADKFTYVAAPTVGGVAPNSGPTSGGTTVTLTGTNLANATEVDFGPGNMATITADSATSITVTDPSHAAAGPVDVTVITAGGTSATSSFDKFTYVKAPTVTSISPNSGPTNGPTTVTINGTNFAGATGVSFGGTAATILSNTGTVITVNAPFPHAVGPVDVTVTNAVGTSAINPNDVFTYVTSPTVSSITPNSGPTAGNTSVTITGSGFLAATAVKFGSVAATFTIVDDNHITATSPSESAGVVHVTVTAPSGTSSTSAADKFTYVAAPTVGSITPNSGSTAGGTTVTITGTNLDDPTAVDFGPGNLATIVSHTPTSITVTDPSHGAGTVNVTVTTAGGTSSVSPADKFTYVTMPAPTVTSISPTSGSTAGGTSVTITGTNLAGATAVDFGPGNPGTITADSATSITVTSPPHVAGPVDVTVTTAGGTSVTNAGDQFTYVVAPSTPTVTGVSPSSGQYNAHTAVTITGSGFTGATAVHFGSVTTTSFTINSDTQITVAAPTQVPNTVDVTVTTPAGTSPTGPNDKYTYTSTGLLGMMMASPSAAPSIASASAAFSSSHIASIDSYFTQMTNSGNSSSSGSASGGSVSAFNSYLPHASTDGADDQAANLDDLFASLAQEAASNN